jgi:hypothetical protein
MWKRGFCVSMSSSTKPSKRLEFPRLTKIATATLKQAQARDITIEEKYGAEACGKDTRAFWFLMGYWMGESH